MTVEQLHRSLFGALVAKDYDALRAACGPDYSYCGPDGSRGDIETVLAVCALYNTAFPDLSVEVERQWSPADDISIAEYTATGTHLGALGDIPPTGRTATTRGCSIIQTRDGKVSHEAIYFDSLTLMQQLGLAPSAL